MGTEPQSVEARDLPVWVRKASKAAILGAMIAGICASSAAFAETKPAVTAGHETVDDDGDVVPQVATPTSSANTVTVPDDAEWSIDPMEIVEARGLRPVPMAPITAISLHNSKVNFDLHVLRTDADVTRGPDGRVSVHVVPPDRGPDGVFHAYAFVGNPTKVGVAPPEDDDDEPIILLGEDDDNPYPDALGVPTLWGHAEGGLSPFAQLAVDGNVQIGDFVTVGTATGVFTYAVSRIINVSKDPAAAQAEGNPLNTEGADPKTLLVTTCDFLPDGTSTDVTTLVLTMVDAKPLQSAE